MEDGFDAPEFATALATWTNAKQKEYMKNRKKDAMTLKCIHQGVSRSTFLRIMGAKISKEAWEILKQEFGGSEKQLQSRFNLYGEILPTHP